MEYSITSDCATERMIYDHLIDNSNNFKPPLDSYVNISNYSKKIYLKSEKLELIIQKKLIGLLAYYIENDSIYITNLSISRDQIRKGLGSILLKKLFRVNTNIKKFRLEVFNENRNALNFYLKHNFKIEQTKKNKFILIKNEKF